ncbi:MAG: ATP synthase F1 subunit gamma [Clostridiales bacterium]|nr:ATP synthase F1 subunit gamma [Clostridiales bacterium]
MPSAREIKNHMESVKNTRKITNAMYLIASTKLRKAKADLDRTRPYFEAVRKEIKRIFRTVDGIDSPYFYPADPDDHLTEGTYGCLVITADKGLAGAYNQNVLKEMQKLLKGHPDTELFVVGESGRRFCVRHDIPIERSFRYTAQNPTMERAREIAQVLMERYESGRLKKIFIIYTDMESSLQSEAITTRLLPFHRSYFAMGASEKKVSQPFEFIPSVEEVLRLEVHGYVAGYIYSALVDSFCSEQNARMTAMDSANQNAEKLLGELSLQYNRVRQAAITREITEVSAGALAQRRKRRKEVETP